MEGQELASQVSTSAPYDFGPADATARVAIIDFGVKKEYAEVFCSVRCTRTCFSMERLS